MTAPDLLLIPPFLKYIAGPPLGPAMLRGAAEAAGYALQVLDLNARLLGQELTERQGDPRFVGDHDRPSEALRTAQDRFRARCAGALPPAETRLADDPIQTLTYAHGDILAAVARLSDGPVGAWIEGALAPLPAPRVVGVSVLYSGQVLWGLVASHLARRRWPGCLIVWGGPHVTALQDRIAADPQYGTHVHRFVFGYAEQTFVEILQAAHTGAPLPAEAVAAGAPTRSARDDLTALPRFSELDRYGTPQLTLPAQLSRGCSYGRCRFCTYPAIEGGYRPLPDAGVRAVLDEAVSRGAAVALKDSLLLPQRLADAASAIAGRARWSACTKLHPRLDTAFLRQLAAGGCATLEFGLETLSPTGQAMIDKRQSADLFLRVLDGCAESGISVVVNYITGFPGVPADEDARWLAFVRDALATRPTLTGKIEHNRFQLERLSPMGRAPASSGLRVTERWPWASVLGWELLG